MGYEDLLIPSLIWFCDVTTVGLCVICKIPQILTILKLKSVEGLSSSSLLLELLTYAISLSYNWMKGYPLGSYLEDPFLSLQTLAVLLMVYFYEGKLNILKFGMVGGGAAVFYALALGFPHPAVLPLLLTATLPMKVFSKLLQIKAIWAKRSAGNLSMVSWVINIYTCLTRIITTAIVTGDQTLLLKHTLSVTLNCLVVLSAWKFRNNTPVKGEEGEEKANGRRMSEEVKGVGSVNGKGKQNNKNRNKKKNK